MERWCNVVTHVHYYVPYDRRFTYVNLIKKLYFWGRGVDCCKYDASCLADELTQLTDLTARLQESKGRSRWTRYEMPSKIGYVCV